MKNRFGLIFLLGLIVGCSAPRGESLPVEGFNIETAEVHRLSTADWPESCLLVALRFVGDREAVCWRRIEISSGPERFNEAEIIITEEGLMDDSLDGYRHRLELRKTLEGYWLVEAADRSWKCVSGRGHTSYSCAPCE